MNDTFKWQIPTAVVLMCIEQCIEIHEARGEYNEWAYPFLFGMRILEDMETQPNPYVLEGP